jgi:hypothetical protein
MHGQLAPTYVVTREGNTNMDFEVTCLVQGKEMGRGIGKNKNEAGTRAAMQALERLRACTLQKEAEEQAATEKPVMEETMSNSSVSEEESSDDEDSNAEKSDKSESSGVSASDEVAESEGEIDLSSDAE